MDDLHMTRLIEWAVNRFGRALAWSLLAAFVIAVIGASAQQPTLYGLAGFAGVLVFALYLGNVSAPLPDFDADLDDADADADA